MESMSAEQKNTLPNFQRIFADRLQSIEPLSNRDELRTADWPKEFGINQVVKAIPVLMFKYNHEDIKCVDVDWISKEYNAWITDPKQIERKGQPHHELRKEMASSLGIEEEELDANKLLWQSPGILLQSEDSKLYFLADHIGGPEMKERIKTEVFEIQILDFLRRYGISKIIARITKENVDGGPRSIPPRNEVIVNEDAFGKLRELMFYVNFARQYNMTNSQYLRLRARTRSAFNAGIPIVWDEVAREIINEEETSQLI